MSIFKKPNPRDLAVPAEVERDPKAREILRAWVANGGLVCSLRPETWDDPASWGIALADAARHIANAIGELKGDDPASTISRISAVFNAEVASPTDEPRGRIEDDSREH